MGESKAALLGRALARSRRWLILLGVLAAVEALYVFYVSAGFLADWPSYNTNYDLQAEGFRSGHLWVALPVAPELLAQANPFDPVNSRWWAWDFSLYKGHYYIYWGPLPALVIAAIKTITGRTAPIGDQFVLFTAMSLAVLAGALLIERMARRLFARVPFGMVVATVVVFALGNPFPYLVATAGIYQAAIMSAQALILLGLVAAFEGLWRRVEGRPGTRRWLATAGLAWGLAIACRVSAGPTVAALILITVLFARGRYSKWRSAARDLVAIAAPVALSGLALLLYNKLRFASWTEFGTSIQLSTMRFRTSPSYVLPNLYSYLLRPLVWTCHFPFVETPWDIGPRGFPAGYVLPAGYSAQEPVAGMWRTAPWSLLAPLAAIAGASSLWRARREAGSLGALPDVDRLRFWSLGCFFSIALITGLPVIALFIPTIRYLGDVAAGICLAGVWFAFWVTTRLEGRPWPRRGAWLALASLAAVTIGLGFLLGFQGYIGHFKRFNPAFLERLDHAFSRCR
jgi:hypothetical protein